MMSTHAFQYRQLTKARTTCTRQIVKYKRKEFLAGSQKRFCSKSASNNRLQPPNKSDNRAQVSFTVLREQRRVQALSELLCASAQLFLGSARS